jgi:hypothetical protein
MGSLVEIVASALRPGEPEPKVGGLRQPWDTLDDFDFPMDLLYTPEAVDLRARLSGYLDLAERDGLGLTIKEIRRVLAEPNIA